jgi:putative glutamine amidotransferase
VPRPLIGISCYLEEVQWGVWGQTRAAVLPARYPDSVLAAGGRPVLLPPVPEPDSDAEDTVGRLDGLILAGGGDLDPGLYGAQPHPETGGVRPDRDAAEVALGRAALAQRLPLLGICRGMQLLTVLTGGRLIQHLPDIVGHDRHRAGPGEYATHPVRLAPGTGLHALLGEAERVDVPSYHHQGVASVGPHITVSGWADDGTVEAVELPDQPFAYGVLWHPEAGDDPRLFAALVEAAYSGVT